MMKIVSCEIGITRKDLEHVIERFPFFEFGIEHWQINRMYFKNKVISDKPLQASYVGKNSIEIKTPSGYLQVEVEIDLDDDFKRIFRTIRPDMPDEVYFTMMDYGFEINNPNCNMDSVKRRWTINQICND